jgi:hypothetical protein
VLDTGPIVASIDRSERKHALAARLIRRLYAHLFVPDGVVVEAHYILRSRLSNRVAIQFLEDVRSGAFRRVPLDDALFGRAVELNSMHADLQLGLVDASVMALAEAQRAAVFTFDFKAFRATRPKSGGWWRLVVDEQGQSSELER